MHKIVLASIFAATLFGALPAEAQTAQPLSLSDGDQPALLLVSGGCGPAFHRGPFGGCRPNFGGFYRPYGYRRFGYGYRRFGYGYGYRR